MNRQQNSFLASVVITQQVLTKNAQVYEGFAPLIKRYNQLTDQIEKISDLCSIQISPIPPLTASKQELRELTITKLLIIAGSLKIYAIDHDLFILQEMCKLHPTACRRMTEIVFTNTALKICTAAENLADELIPYQITPAKIHDLKTAILDFSQQMGNTRNAVVIRSTVTFQMKELFREMYINLKQIDSLMITYLLSHPEFHLQYTLSRKKYIADRHLSKENNKRESPQSDTENMIKTASAQVPDEISPAFASLTDAKLIRDNISSESS